MIKIIIIWSSFIIIVGPDIIFAILADIPNKRVGSIIRLLLNLQISNKYSTDCEIRYFKGKFNRPINKMVPLLRLKWRQIKDNRHGKTLIALKLRNIPLNTLLSCIVHCFSLFCFKGSVLTITGNWNKDYYIICNALLFEIAFSCYLKLHFCLWLVFYYRVYHY